MDFSLSPEQALFKDSVERFVRDAYPFEKRCRIIAGEDGFSREMWSQFAELGWLGVAVPEALGGSGGSATEVMIVMEAFGRGLVVEPFLSSVILGGRLAEFGGMAAQRQALLPDLAQGRLILAFAYAEPQSGYDPFDVETTASEDGGGYRIEGLKRLVLHAQAADKIIVSARTAGSSRDRDGISLFLVARDAEGLSRRDYRTLDGGRASDLTLEDVRVDGEALLGAPDQALPVIETAIDHAVAALCAEAVGAMAAALEATNDHLKIRRQFGRPLGDFQVLQHRMVDMFMACEEARSMAYMATCKLGDGDAGARQKALSAAKARIGKAGRFIGGQAVQLHGGMGMTDELIIGHYFKRLVMIDTLFGNADYHLRRFAEL